MGAGPRSDRSPREHDAGSNRMTPWASRSSRFRLVMCVMVAFGIAAVSGEPADAQGKRRRTAQRKESKPSGAKKSGGQGKSTSKVKKEQRFDFTGFELAGSVRMPQLLYFLDRAEEELERASLERRTFVPEMLKSVEDL